MLSCSAIMLCIIKDTVLGSRCASIIAAKLIIRNKMNQEKCYLMLIQYVDVLLSRVTHDRRGCIPTELCTCIYLVLPVY